jgi:hypothetical protein
LKIIHSNITITGFFLLFMQFTFDENKIPGTLEGSAGFPLAAALATVAKKHRSM